MYIFLLFAKVLLKKIGVSNLLLFFTTTNRIARYTCDLHRALVFRVVQRVCRLCSVLECYTFLSFLSFTEYNIIGFPGISMGLFSEHGPCLEHDHETLRPIIVSTWMPEKVGGLPGKSLVFAESQVSFYFVNDLISLQHACCFNQNTVLTLPS